MIDNWWWPFEMIRIGWIMFWFYCDFWQFCYWLRNSSFYRIRYLFWGIRSFVVWYLWNIEQLNTFNWVFLVQLGCFWIIFLIRWLRIPFDWFMFIAFIFIFWVFRYYFRFCWWFIWCYRIFFWCWRIHVRFIFINHRFDWPFLDQLIHHFLLF